MPASSNRGSGDSSGRRLSMARTASRPAKSVVALPRTSAATAERALQRTATPTMAETTSEVMRCTITRCRNRADSTLSSGEIGWERYAQRPSLMRYV